MNKYASISNKLLSFSTVLILTCLFLFTGCGDQIVPDDQDATDQDAITYGSIRFDFPLNDKYGGGVCTKRFDLSIGYTADSLYRKEYLTSANLSDYQGTYTFTLRPGKYFYQAGKICTCLGDSCLWNGYPGGYLGEYWTMGWFELEAGSSLIENITFKK